MRILLDHCLPRQIAGLILGHEVTTARQMGWDKLQNGDLLKAAEQAGFECLLTGDRNLAYQQNLVDRRISIVELNSNRLKVISEQISVVIDVLDKVQAGQYLPIILQRPTLHRRKYSGPES